MPTLDVDGTSLHFELRGSGAPLLLLNGLGLDLTAWGPLAGALERRFRLVLLDARGAGRSAAPPGPYSTARLAADAAALLASLALGPAHVIGLSLGGLVAQELALRAPGAVRAVVLAATAAHLPARTRRVLDAWRRLALAGTDRAALCREQLAWVLSEPSLADERVVGAFEAALAAGTPPAPHGLSAQVDACLAHDARDRAVAIAAPALVLAGREDALLPPAASEALARLLPRARFEELPGGHAFLAESAEAAAARVLEFLDA